ncbi:MAG TPA: AI-2E family transporter [Rhodanobacteraceae bacterium]|nr:AI-2E family transporter [Rhodanobacteraceae bacterium]
MNQLPPVSDRERRAGVSRVAVGSIRLRRFTRHLLGVRVVLNALLVLAVLYTLVLAHGLAIPLVLAAFIGLGLNPLVATAARWHIPRALAALVLMLALTGCIGAGVTLLAQPAATWLQRAPTALRHVAPKLKPLTERLNAATQATQSLVGSSRTERRSGSSAHAAMFTAWDLLQMTPRVLAYVLTVLLLVFFFLIYGDSLLRRLVEISPTFRNKRINVTLVRDIQTQVSRYLLTATSINVSLGLLTAAWLWWLDVPDPLLWGSLTTLFNFIPYVGGITTTLLLAVVGLLQFPNPWHGLIPALGFACLSFTEGNFITPLVMGQSMRLSPVAILIWLLIWGWMWGIPGALLAVPMLTCVKLATEHLPGWRWFAQIVGR